ncbi:hypothetical protein LIER_13775 [Lithospermum erythrorhizon]|uniref:non-specific serine/threonine protein kinase n=1 Tax=Lithospermum erythrorhizon TaxID=34254 RepID=A0AAV3PYB4_LITER
MIPGGSTEPPRTQGPPLLLLILLLCLPFTTPQNTTLQCPLDFTILLRLAEDSQPPKVDTPTQCQYVLQGIRLVLSVYLKNTNSFLPPLHSADSCWTNYQTVVNEFLPGFDARKICGFQTSWIAQGCMNITTRAEFETLVPRTEIEDVVSACNRSLGGSGCTSCTTSIAALHASYLTGGSVGNVSDCRALATIYGAAIGNSEGPTDPGTINCLFSLNFNTQNQSKGKHNNQTFIIVAVVVSAVVLSLAGLGCWYFRRKKKKKFVRNFDKSERTLDFSGLDSIHGNTTFVRFTFDEIKAATKNFSRDYIIGRGGYGNVYKGILPDGSEVAVKRFKNCSAAGDASFSHEVEVIASVRHVNLVAMRGYCSATTQREGYQRIIVCDLVRNGSLHDHLFGSTGESLSWPIRQRIALGTAKGLAYLHYGAQPSIIHRDIKASNILLDDKFEALVADFGLAKFTPEGMTHMSTRVAGTMGYVAPEYALYGQLTDKSDVYSFGIVLLELLSGKKALMAVNDGQPTLLSDWAWSLVRESRTLDVIDETMPGLDSAEVMEKYVLIAVLCSHPQLYARPTMDQVVKMLDTEVPVPSIPDRPIPITADIDDIEKSVSSFGSGRMSTISGYQPYTPRGHSENSSAG